VLLGGVSIFGGRGTIGGVVLATLVLGGLTDALILDDVATEVVTLVTGILLLASVFAPAVTHRPTRGTP